MKKMTALILLNFLRLHVHGFKFLGLFPLPIKSHFIMYEKIFKGLVERGHEIDIVSHYPQKYPIKNLTDIDISGKIPLLDNNVSIENISKMTRFEAAMSMFKTYGADVCEKILRHSALEKLRESNKKYDAIITEVFGTDCLLGFAHKYKVPVIGITSSMHLPWGDERMGNPDNPSYVANYFIPFNKNMTILQKIELAIAPIISKVGYHLISTIPSEMRAREFFGTDLPPLDNLAFNMSLLLVNSYLGISDPRPTVPGLIEVGGLHIEKPKHLPSKLAAVIELAPGAIYFSMGTLIKLNTFAKEKLEAVLKTFSKLPFVILIKAEIEELSLYKIPKNVYLSNWFPQIDILCHPNTKLFITPGGQMSIQEAAYCGVPIIGIPYLPHQVLNVKNFESIHAGICIDYTELDDQNFKKAIVTITEDNSYHKNAQALAAIYKDRPQIPLETALFWIEYVVRHNGAFHLRTKGVDLIWMDYYLLDVALVFMLLFIVFVFLMIKLLNFLQDYFDYSKTTDKIHKKIVNISNNSSVTQ